MDNNRNFNDTDPKDESFTPSDNAPEEPMAEYIPEPEAADEPQPRWNGSEPYRETVYLHNAVGADTAPEKNEPREKSSGTGKLAVIAVICVALSAAAAFGGTCLANMLSGKGGIFSFGISSQDEPTRTAPSVIFEAAPNQNREPGTYTQVAEAVKPSVVEITTESIVTDTYFWGGRYITSGAGSGVIISADGIIITNNHVVDGASTINVTLSDGSEYAAEVIGADSDSDIAVIKIEAADLPFAILGDDDTLTVGEEVIAVGNPLGRLGGTITNGIVSAISRDITIDGTSMALIQTNAAVNPGNSGGGLFNLYGELVGIVNAKSSRSSSGTSVEGIGFAIPVSTVKKVADELMNYGYVRGKAMLGITYVDVKTSYDAMYYRVSALGVYVASSDHPEELKVGDRIVAVNGEEVNYGADVKEELKKYSVGDEITVSVVRGGKYVDSKVVLQEYVPTDVSTSGNRTETHVEDVDPDEFESNFGRK